MRSVRSQRAASRSSWVTSTSAVSVSARSENIRSTTLSPVAVSRLPVGSSANRIVGRDTNARASATRCCSPPDSCSGWWPPRWPSPTSSSIARAAGAASSEPAISSGSMTFSSAVSPGSSWKFWNTKPTRPARSRARASSSSAPSDSPSIVTSPADGRSSPARIPSSVDLPDPDGPTIAAASPAATASSRPDRITSSPSGPSTRLSSPVAASTTVPEAGRASPRADAPTVTEASGAACGASRSGAASPGETVEVKGTGLRRAGAVEDRLGIVRATWRRSGNRATRIDVPRARIDGH